jgi:hypothetical protein
VGTLYDSLSVSPIRYDFVSLGNKHKNLNLPVWAGLIQLLTHTRFNGGCNLI